MEFNSIEFLVFLVLVLLFYYLIPKKLRPLLLFLSGFFFYMSWNVGYGCLLALVMSVSYFGALALDTSGESRKKRILLLCIIFDIAILFVFKYTGMLVQTINDIRSVFGQTKYLLNLNILLPIGISFYIFQSLGYLIDVYRKKVDAEKNFINYGAFVAFFPQLVAGPIERSSNLLAQINNSQNVKLNQESLSKGIFQMLFGFFEKVVIADSIAGVVTIIYSDYQYFGGIYIVLATVLFAFQIYCDFDGYTNIAIGVARLFGIKLIRNFNTPYFSTSITEFWRRWHISLSSWLKDYVYISLGGNRGSKIEKYRNIMITFLVSGIWHGANWTYVIWGLMHGVFQIFEDRFNLIKENRKNIKVKAIDSKAINRKIVSSNRIKNVLKGLVTFVLVDFAWLYFRASSVGNAFSMIGQIFANFNFKAIFDRDTAIRLEVKVLEWGILLLSLLLLVIIDIVKYRLDQKGDTALDIYDCAYSLPICIKVVIVVLSVLFILIFGHYGPSYDSAQFIYFQF